MRNRRKQVPASIPDSEIHHLLSGGQQGGAALIQGALGRSNSLKYLVAWIFRSHVKPNVFESVSIVPLGVIEVKEGPHVFLGEAAVCGFLEKRRPDDAHQT